MARWPASKLEPAVYDIFDDARHVVDILPPMSDWLCVSVDYGTTNPLHALLIGLGVDGTLYVVAEITRYLRTGAAAPEPRRFARLLARRRPTGSSLRVVS